MQAIMQGEIENNMEEIESNMQEEKEKNMQEEMEAEEGKTWISSST